MGRPKIKIKKQEPRIKPINITKQDIDELLSKIDKHVKITELKMQMSLSKLHQELTEVKTNQIVTQNLLLNKKTFEEQEFKNLFDKFMEENIGIVTEGFMNGDVAVSMYNIDKKSGKKIKEGGHPICILN